MSDLIKREDAIKVLTEVLFDEPPYLNSIEKCEAFARKTLENIPSAEPKQGEWIEDNYVIKCSVCGKREDEFIDGWGEWEIDGRTRYCPNCGARMKGADDESRK